MKITSLEGFECGGSDQRERRLDVMSACPPVTVNPLGSLSDRARNGHALQPTRPRSWIVLGGPLDRRVWAGFLALCARLASVRRTSVTNLDTEGER